MSDPSKSGIAGKAAPLVGRNIHANRFILPQIPLIL